MHHMQFSNIDPSYKEAQVAVRMFLNRHIDAEQVDWISFFPLKNALNQQPAANYCSTLTNALQINSCSSEIMLWHTHKTIHNILRLQSVAKSHWKETCGAFLVTQISFLEALPH